jgi:hypothetical protein
MRDAPEGRLSRTGGDDHRLHQELAAAEDEHRNLQEHDGVFPEIAAGIELQPLVGGLLELASPAPGGFRCPLRSGSAPAACPSPFDAADVRRRQHIPLVVQDFFDAVAQLARLRRTVFGREPAQIVHAIREVPWFPATRRQLSDAWLATSTSRSRMQAVRQRVDPAVDRQRPALVRQADSHHRGLRNMADRRFDDVQLAEAVRLRGRSSSAMASSSADVPLLHDRG